MKSASSAKEGRKRVMLLYTGGTMGMKPQADGSLAPEAGYLTERITQMPELHSVEMPEFIIKEYSPLLDSSCMGPSDWVKIAEDIETNYLNFDGFVVIMGTDTMAYASSALSFMLENLGKTVAFTGSQIPFCEVYNDARRNLIVSMIFAVHSDFPEVCICFSDKVFRANRTVKVNSHSLDAFDSPNFPPLAILGTTISEQRNLSRPQPRGALKVHKQLDSRVIVLKLVPGFDDEAIEALITYSTTLKGIVLELYGTGNGPAKKTRLLEAFRAAVARGIVIVAVSQCLRGGVNLSTYSMGKDFAAVGVVSGGDMTTEAVSTKLAYLFGRNIDPTAVAQRVGEDLRGELTATETQENGRPQHTKYFFNNRL